MNPIAIYNEIVTLSQELSLVKTTPKIAEFLTLLTTTTTTSANVQTWLNANPTVRNDIFYTR